MGKRSAPPVRLVLRKALWFGRVEAAILLGSLLVTVIAGAIGFSRDRAVATNGMRGSASTGVPGMGSGRAMA